MRPKPGQVYLIDLYLRPTLIRVQAVGYFCWGEGVAKSWDYILCRVIASEDTQSTGSRIVVYVTTESEMMARYLNFGRRERRTPLRASTAVAPDLPLVEPEDFPLYVNMDKTEEFREMLNG